jgi:hypothetical protein
MGSKNAFNTAHSMRWMSELERLEQKEQELDAIHKYMPQIHEALQEQAERAAQKAHRERLVR